MRQQAFYWGKWIGMCCMLWCIGCSNQASQEAKDVPPAVVPVPEAVSPSPAAENPDHQALRQTLRAYYDDLEAESIDPAQYFAPTVDQFFQASQISNQRVGESLERSFKQVDGRSITLDDESFSFVTLKDGIEVTFSGSSASRPTQGGKKNEVPFQNRVTVNNQGLIVRFESVAQNEAHKRTQALDPNLRTAVDKVLKALRSGTYQEASYYIHPELGYYYIVKPGAISIPKQGQSLDMLAEAGPYRLPPQPLLCGHYTLGTLPTFDCRTLFSKQGCYLERLSQPYKAISQLMQTTNSADPETYKANRLSQARLLEEFITVALVDSEAELALYFGMVAEKWYLFVLDRATFDCDA